MQVTEMMNGARSCLALEVLLEVHCANPITRTPMVVHQKPALSPRIIIRRGFLIVPLDLLQDTCRFWTSNLWNSAQSFMNEGRTILNTSKQGVTLVGIPVMVARAKDSPAICL